MVACMNTERSIRILGTSVLRFLIGCGGNDVGDGVDSSVIIQRKVA